MATITVGLYTKTTYVSLAEADEILAFAIHAATYRGLSDTERSRLIGSAMDMLERQTWDGDPAVDGQATAFPRSGLTDEAGDDVTEAASLTAAELANAHLAAILADDPSAAGATTAGSNVKKVDAKGVSVEFFGPRAAGRFPQIVQELVGPFLASVAGAADALAPRVSGTDAESAFEPCDAADNYDLTGGM